MKIKTRLREVTKEDYDFILFECKDKKTAFMTYEITIWIQVKTISCLRYYATIKLYNIEDAQEMFTLLTTTVK